MKTAFWIVLLAVVWYVGANMGAGYRADQIQATCESEDAPTIINGTTYVCFSQRAIQRMREEQRQHHGNET
jgi:hypothetical protein